MSTKFQVLSGMLVKVVKVEYSVNLTKFQASSEIPVKVVYSVNLTKLQAFLEMPVIVVYSVNLSCNCLWKYWSKWYIRSIFKSSKPFWKCQPKWHIWSILRKAPSLFGNAIQSGILGQSCKVLTSKCLWKCWSDRVHKKHFQLKNRCKLPWLFKCERWFYLQHCLKAQSMKI